MESPLVLFLSIVFNQFVIPGFKSHKLVEWGKVILLKKGGECHTFIKHF